mgnify:CR=1 FL=1
MATVYSAIAANADLLSVLSETVQHLVQEVGWEKKFGPGPRVGAGLSSGIAGAMGLTGTGKNHLFLLLLLLLSVCPPQLFALNCLPSTDLGAIWG